MVKNSVGNVTEILNLLDRDNYGNVQLAENYKYLVSKWGEHEIMVGSISIRYVDIGNALFSGLMIMFSTLTIGSFCIAVMFGKIIFPLLAKHFKNSNEEMVDLATLKSASQIDEISRREWF